jgi:hypothetical protein
METATTPSRKEYRKVGGIVLTIALAAFIGGSLAVSARADENGYGHDAQYQGDRGAQYQGDRGEQNRRDSQSYRYGGTPAYVYAPPPVYYAPTPQPPVIDLVFPLNFR